MARRNDITAGTVVGDYTIVREIGRGGMAAVFEATNAEGARFAIRLLQTEVKDDAIVERFEREGQILYALRHENLASIFELGTLDDGRPFQVMELLQGIDLQQRIEEEGMLAIHDLCRIVIGACRGVGAAHACNVIHRDLKPSNIFLARGDGDGETVKVLDFGVAKTFGEESLTPTSAIVGSPQYLAPEQLAEKRELLRETDVWALGVVLYRGLTENFPFDAPNLALLCRAILHGEPASLRDQRPDCPDELERVVLRCLEKTPSKRFSSLEELATALAPFAVKPPRSSYRTRVTPDAATLAALAAAGKSSSPPKVAPSEVPPKKSDPDSGPPSRKWASELPARKSDPDNGPPSRKWASELPARKSDPDNGPPSRKWALELPAKKSDPAVAAKASDPEVAANKSDPEVAPTSDPDVAPQEKESNPKIDARKDSEPVVASSAEISDPDVASLLKESDPDPEVEASTTKSQPLAPRRPSRAPSPARREVKASQGSGNRLQLIAVALLCIAGTAGFAFATGWRPFTAVATQASLRVKTQPEEAFFSIDNGPRLTTAQPVTVASDGSMHTISVWKDGYRAETRTVVFSGDVALDLVLVPLGN